MCGGGGGDTRDDSAEILFQSFLQEALLSSSGRDVHSLMLSIQHLLCRPRRRLPSNCLEGWFGEAVVACDMPEPCKFPSLDGCQKRFHKEIDLTPHPAVGLVLQVGDAEKFPQALGFESLDSFFQSQHAGSMFHSRKEGWR